MSTKYLSYITFCLSISHVSSSFQDYGPFNLKLIGIDTCKGPKRKECCIETVQRLSGSILQFDLLVKENVIPMKAKIMASLNGKEILRLQIAKPCDHLFMRPLLSSIMNMTKDCNILQGHYTFNINIEELARSYYGGRFMYGNWTFKTLFHNEDCNFTCNMFYVVLSPRNRGN